MVEGSDALLDRLGRVMEDEFDPKMLGRVGRGQLTEVKFFERTLRWHEREMSFSWSGGTIRQRLPCCLGLQTLEL